jgi:protein-arginine kinase
MKPRMLESDTRMRFLLGSNPIGELVKVVSNECKLGKNETRIKNRSQKS